MIQSLSIQNTQEIGLVIIYLQRPLRCEKNPHKMPYPFTGCAQENNEVASLCLYFWEGQMEA